MSELTLLAPEAEDQSSSRELTAAVVVCTSSREREPLVRACVDSLLGGVRRPEELFVVVDCNESLADDLRTSLPFPVRLLECKQQGLSAARNVGVAAATSDVVAFIDDDATADLLWLSSIMKAFAAERQFLGLGGPVLPKWAARRRWMPDELLWVVGCTYTGHRVDAGPIRNPIGCNMAFRRRELLGIGSFETSFGKRGTALATCDETELALRLERAHGPERIGYVPGAKVHHLVPASRVSWRLVVRRALSEGLAKGRLRRRFAQPALAPERSYALLLLSHAVPRLLRASVRERSPEPALGAVAILAALTISACAFVVGVCRELSLHGGPPVTESTGGGDVASR